MSMPPPISRRKAKARALAVGFEVSPALLVLAHHSVALARLPDALLAVVSRFLSLVPETQLLRSLMAAGRVPNDLLVEMARVSCAPRRLAWSQGGFAYTKQRCAASDCRWRNGNRRCVTAHCGYTRSAFLKRRLRAAPRGCWDVRVRGSTVPYVKTVLARLGGTLVPLGHASPRNACVNAQRTRTPRAL